MEIGNAIMFKPQGGVEIPTPVRNWNFANDSLIDTINSKELTTTGITFTEGRTVDKRACLLDATSDLITIVEPLSLETISYSYWWKTGTLNSGAVYVGLCSQSDNNIPIRIIPDKLLVPYNGSSIFTSSFNFAANTQYNIICVYSVLSLKIYINGTLILDIPNFGNKSGDPIKYIGYRGSFGSIGKIEDLQIWNIALSENDISNIYNNG